MLSTRLSLVHGLGSGADDAWSQLDLGYRPLIYGWLRKYQLQESDAEDVAQEVMAVVARRIRHFSHNGHVGAFRCWLRVITIHAARKYLERRQRQPDGTGASKMQHVLEQLEVRRSSLARQIDVQHQRFVLHSLLHRISSRFQEKTLEAFRLHAIEGRDATEVAEQLEVRPQTVYVAKARVLHALRELAASCGEDDALLG